MNLDCLNREYDRLQRIYGDSSLHSIYNGGQCNNPDVCFVFMNPTKRNIASSKEWKGIHSPWIGTKNIWSLFYDIGLVDDDIYSKIRELKGNEWSEEFASEVYGNVQKNGYFITNLAKCTQIDARPLPDKVFVEYLDLLEKEIACIKPKLIILFGNQVSSIFLGEKICVSKVRRKLFEKEIDGVIYPCYAVYYPVGNGRFNMDKAVSDIKFIMNKE